MATKKKAPPSAKAKASIKSTLVNVILDRSGSMSSCRQGTISGYNEYLGGLRADKDSSYDVSLIQFDSTTHGPELTVSYADKSLAEVKDLAESDYEPRGGTPLYDAIGECVRKVEAKGRGVLTVIITDGMENSSQEFTADSIKVLIKEKEAEGWAFVFLGANIDSAKVGGSMGVAATNCANYAPGREKHVYQTMVGMSRGYAGATRTFGAGSPQARASASIRPGARAAMMGPRPGGRPSAPPIFPTPSKRRDWTVNPVNS